MGIRWGFFLLGYFHVLRISLYGRGHRFDVFFVCKDESNFVGILLLSTAATEGRTPVTVR